MLQVLDLFCCAGGAAKGYHDAGFNVTGVDIKQQKHYPYKFIQADALEYMENWLVNRLGEQETIPFDLIHASPPCQAFSALSNSQPGTKAKYPDLIDPVRKLLKRSGLPYVIENVPGSPLDPTAILCGSMFGKRLRLHRLFETSFPVVQLKCSHKGYVLNPHARDGRRRMREEFGLNANQAKIWRNEKGVPWMNWDEASEAILPVYTEYIGRQLKENYGKYTVTADGTRDTVQDNR